MAAELEKVDQKVSDKVIAAIESVVAHVPTSNESVAENPTERSSAIALVASSKAAAVSGSLSLPPGPIGMLTIIPDLLVIWRIQQQMVVDIAAAHGKQAEISQEQMIYCLFRHAVSQLARDLLVRVGERVIVRKATMKGMQQILEKVGIRVTQRAIGRAASRWIPIVGAVAVGTYAFYDTRQVSKTAMDLFGREVSTGDAA
jgi:hypothetical protein